MMRLTKAALAAVLALGVVACQPATKEDVEALKEQQGEILKKLAALEEGIKNAAAPARRGPPPEDYDKVHQIDLDGAPVLGNPNAPITIVEYSDFECPYCARSAPEVKEVLEKYPDKVRIVYKHFPLSFHRAARPTAVGSVAAQEQGKFWEYHDVLFEATSKRQLGGSDEDLIKYAEKAGLDVEKFKKDLATRRAEFEKRVSDDFVSGQKVNVRGTPTLYLNGKKVRNRSLPALSAEIDKLLAEMEKG